MLTEKALKILTEDRKLDPEILSKLGIESTTGWAGSESVAIPYFQGAERVNCKHRTISGEKRFRQEPDAKKCFWNINALMDASLSSEPIVITEGEFDCIVALQAGYQRSISVPDGAPSKALGDEDTAKYSYLDDTSKLFSNEQNIILAFDNDGPGINLLNDMALRLGKTRCKFVRYPDGCKDLNDVLKKHGLDAVRECLAKASWYKSDGVYKVSELPPIAERPILHMGFKPLDDFYKISTGYFYVVTGIPSHGKSSFLNDFACRMAYNHNWRTAFASFEQTPQTDHRDNLRAWKMKDYADKLSTAQLAEADEWIDRHFRFIVVGDDDFPSLEWMLEKISISAVQHNCQCVVIDPWNEMDHMRPKEMSLTEYTGFAIKSFKRMARLLNITLVVAAHPAKLKKEDGKYAPPSLYDISDSAHWSNKADMGLTIFRPDLTQNETHIIVNKVRYQPKMGMPGVVKAHFVSHMKRYEAIEE